MAAENTAKPSSRGAKPASSRTRTARATKAEVTETAGAGVDPISEAEPPQATVSQASASPAKRGEAMSTDNNVVQMNTRPPQADEKPQKSAIQLHQPTLDPHKLPPMSSEIQVSETMSVAGIRPIEASHLALVGSFLNGRPIAASTLKVSEMLPGDRPIFDSEFKMAKGLMLSGNRPIMESDPALLGGSPLLGNRPIASNIIDPEPAALMGYLD